MPRAPHSIGRRWQALASRMFSSTGHVSSIRIHILVASYSFDDVDGDFELKHFDMGLTHDMQAMIPLMLEAQAISPNPIRIFASPWSPPAWMKTPMYASNGTTFKSMCGSQWPTGVDQHPQYLEAWALYFSKFITAYKQKGISLWGVTVQNEPEFPAPWEACLWDPWTQRDFIKKYLGPQLAKDHPDVKILAFDHNKDHLAVWAEAMYSDPEAAKYVHGLGFHWYSGDFFYRLEQAHLIAPDKIMLGTEACHCPHVRLGDWRRGEGYGHDILGDLLHWAVGWTDWNLVLDMNGGPNHLSNMCDAPIIADHDNDRVIVQPMYYFMGHFSKFLVPGSQALRTTVLNQPHPSEATVGMMLVVTDCDSSSPFQLWEMVVREDNSPQYAKDSHGFPAKRTQVRIRLKAEPELCVSVAGSSIGDGSNVILDECASAEHVVNDWLWMAGPPEITASGHSVVVGGGGPAHIVTAASGKCLYVPDLSFQTDTEVEVSNKCDFDWHQKGWAFDPRSGLIKDVGTDLCLASNLRDPVQAVAATRPDGKTVLVVQNQGDTDSQFRVAASPKGASSSEATEVLLSATTIPAHSIQTYIFSD
eukprot:g62067.t1